MRTLCLLTYPILTALVLALLATALGYRWLVQSHQGEGVERDERLLVTLLALGLASLGAFLVVAFLRVSSC